MATLTAWACGCLLTAAGCNIGIIALSRLGRR